MLGIWFKALTQEYLDVSLRPVAGITARIVQKPGLWMHRDEIDRLLADMRQIARMTLPEGDLNYGILTGDADRLAKSIVTILHDRQTGQPVAFNALAAMDVRLHGQPAEVLHMGLVMVDPSVRSQGFSWVLYGLTCLILFARNKMRPLWLSNVTQVPAIVGMVSETFSNVYPSPRPGSHRSFEHRLLARAILRDHRYVFGVGEDAGFDEDRFVITNAYTGGSNDLKKTFEAAPKHREAIYNDFCRAELDYDRGDDILQLCQLSLDTARRFVLRDVPTTSLPAVVGAIGFVTLNRLILPVVYWFSAGHTWGILRPWHKKGGKPA